MIIADTHVVIWMLQSDPMLGREAQAVLSKAGDGEGIGIPAIALWEIAMRVDKGRLSLGRPLRQWIDAVLAMPGLSLLAITPAIAVDAGTLPGPIHGDPADRLIIATARAHASTLMTADGLILAYAAAGHLEAIDASR